MDSIDQWGITKDAIRKVLQGGGMEAANAIVQFVAQEIGMSHAPVGSVRWVPVDKVKANDYNPNSVPKNELRLLKISIENDGYTQPVVTVYDKDKDQYVIVDGFHRYFTMVSNADIRELYHGYLPIVVLDKPIEDRMASTVRHNRARGKHSVGGMGYLVQQFREKGWDDEQICKQIGLEPDELIRLEHMTGVAELFKDRNFGRAWEEVSTILGRKKQDENNQGL